MKQLSMVLIFLALGMSLALGIAYLTELPVTTSVAFGALISLLAFLMIDIRPEPKPTDTTLIRLTKGDWLRKRH